MNAEINSAYESAKKVLALWRKTGKEHIETLEQLAKAEAQYKSTVAFVTSELEGKQISKTALRELVNGDERVLQAEAEVNELKRKREAHRARIDYLIANYDLEKKRMQAEMDEAKRMNLSE